jgi:hypothetical protein
MRRRKLSPPKPTTGYAVVGCAGGLAPFYGWSFRKYEMEQKLECHGEAIRKGLQVVKVTITRAADKGTV